MKIPRGEFQAEPNGESSSSSGATGVSPVNDGQDARPTKTGQSPEDRHSQAEPGNERKAITGILKDPHSRLFLLAGISTLPLLVAVAVFVVSTGLPDRCMDKDMSMLELYTLHALRGEQYVGPYSRFGWNHPGPSYFYLMVPLYWLSGESASTLFLTARIINAVSFGFLALLVVGVLRKKDPVLAICTVVLLTFYLARLGPELLGSPWNPWIVIAPFGAFVATLALFATGRIAFLPVIVALGSFLVQTHVGMVPCVLALCATSVSLLIVRRSLSDTPRDAISGGRIRVWIGLSTVLFVVMWIFPLVEEVRHHPGNLSKLLSFFHDTTAGNSVSDSFVALSKQVSWFPLYILKKLPMTVPAFEYDLLAQVFTVLQMVLLPLVLRAAIRDGLHFRACLGALGSVGVLAGMWSALRIRGDIFPYLISWMSVTGLFNWAVIGTAGIQYVNGKFAVGEAEQRVRSQLAVTAAYIVITALTVLQLPVFTEASRRAPEDSLKVRMLSRDLMSYLRANDVQRFVICFDWSQWSVQAGVIVQMYKSNLDFAVMNTRSKHATYWPLLFPRSRSPRGHDEKHIVFGPCALRSDGRASHICACGETHIYLWKHSNPDGKP